MICYSVSDINSLIDAVFIGERILRVFDADEVCFVRKKLEKERIKKRICIGNRSRKEVGVILTSLQAPMVLAGLPSSSPSIITKESIALVTSKLRCEFVTLTTLSTTNVDGVFFRYFTPSLSLTLLLLFMFVYSLIYSL